MSLNRVTLIRNLGADTQLKTNASITLCTFSVATNEIYGTGMDRKHKEWHHLRCLHKWRHSDSNLSRMLGKLLL